MAPKSSASPKKAPTSSASKKPQSKPSGRTASTKQPLPVPERLKQLFNSLCAQIDGGHFNNAIKTCDKILRLNPGDSDAIQTKLFLLLQTEQYNPALSLIGAEDQTAQYTFEKAYSLYRLQRETDAQDIVREIREDKGDEDRGVLHLAAQLHYRQGSYQGAFDLYNQLLDTCEPQSEEHSDILTNLQASQKHLDFINTDFLHALDTLPASVTTSIESAPPPPQPVSSTAAALASASSTATAGPTDDAPNITVKKVRKSRVPAGVVPGVTPPPDPERWLKKSERSTFGQGRRRKGAGGGGGGGATQGSVETAPTHPSGHSAKPTGGKGRKKK